jgi:5-methylcytosine-specific restriction endonuclease McrA
MGYSNYNESMNSYMKNRWEQRRAEALEKLGGKCVRCGTSSNLEFDHILPETKKMTSARASSMNEKFFWEEVAKCQLLCKRHHIEKTAKEIGAVGHGEGKTGKRGCKCTPCKERKAEYMRAYRSK